MLRRAGSESFKCLQSYLAIGIVVLSIVVLSIAVISIPNPNKQVTLPVLVSIQGLNSVLGPPDPSF